MNKNILSTILVLFTTGITLGTSVAGVMKIAQSFQGVKGNENVPEVKTLTLGSSQTNVQENANQQSSDNRLTSTDDQRAEVTVSPSPSASPTPSVSPSPSPSPTPSNHCIITLFGKQYDVTTLLSTHSGGNVFTCGTDMTMVYQSQHGTDLTRMQPYLVTSNSGSSASPSPSPSASPGRTEDHEIEHDDEDAQEHQDEQEVQEHNDNQSAQK